MRYIITSDKESTAMKITTCGHYKTPNFFTTYYSQLLTIISNGNGFIGNYQCQNGNYHSVVLIPIANQIIKLYDPWDGFTEIYTMKQLFETGFLTNLGKSIIQWIQYIEPRT